MPSLDVTIDDLSQIDSHPSAADREAAEALIRAELDPLADTVLHPAVRDTQHEPSFSSAINQMHANIENTSHPRLPDTGIDLGRYEDLAAPDDANDTAAWRELLLNTQIAQAYVDSRLDNLQALESHGKNAWLIGNFQTENTLRALEAETNQTRIRLQDAEEQSRQAQAPVKAELDAMRQTFQDGLGRALEAEIATETRRRETRELLSFQPTH